MEMLRSETAADRVRMSAALAGLRAYQEADRAPAPPLMPASANRFGAALRDYGGDGPPLLVIPSLINPPNVLDLTMDRSLLRWLATGGRRVFLLDWGCDSMARRQLSVAGHVEEIILPMIATLPAPPALLGYCIGGTMAAAAAALAPCTSLVTIAAPWHFAGFSAEARSTLEGLWARARPVAASLGVLPMEVLQAAFWSLDPARTIAKFEEFAAMDPQGERARAFVTLEDWANDGPPIPEAAAREMFDSFFEADTPGSGRWMVSGKPIDPGSFDCPQLHVVSTTDRIVPAASAITAGERLELAQGHVGMVVGSRARQALWEPLAHWLAHEDRRRKR
jgi:polyhydroxyalkanoate synthase